jgi:cobalamin biosynthesis Mg chelatase CobN
VKRLAVVCLAALVLAGPVSTSANAESPSTTVCRNKIINEWEGTGRIRTTYPLACYTAALAYVKKQADLRTYSSIVQDIRAALLARKARSSGKKAPTFVGKAVKPQTTTSAAGPVSGSGGSGSGGTGTGSGGPTTTGPGGTGTGSSGPGTTLSSQQDSGGSSGTPLPVLILGGVAIVLVAAGAIGTGIRHSRRRGA